VVRFRIRRGEAERRGIRWPRFERSDYFVDPRWAVPQRFIATMGMPVDDQGSNEDGNLNLACRNAVLNMIALLQERGFSREQAYVICSVAVVSGSTTWWTCRTSSCPPICRSTSSSARNSRAQSTGASAAPAHSE
jgi:acetamidase/formamidase